MCGTVLLVYALVGWLLMTTRSEIHIMKSREYSTKTNSVTIKKKIKRLSTKRKQKQENEKRDAKVDHKKKLHTSVTTH